MNLRVKKLYTLLIVFILIIISGCTTNEHNESKESSPPVDMTKLSNKTSINQKESNRAKEILSQNENVSQIHGVNSSDKLLVAIEMPHMKRFRLNEIEKQLRNQLKEEFPKLDVHLSTDQKIILELEKLEEKINSSSVSKKDLEKKLKEIINLSKEKT